MTEILKPYSRGDWATRYLRVLMAAWMSNTNAKWDAEVAEETGMFRNDEPGQVELESFIEYYKKLEHYFYPGDASFVQETRDDKHLYFASAQALRSGRISNGPRFIDPEKPNFIFAPWASQTESYNLTKKLKLVMPELNNFNVLAVSAHGHRKIFDNLPGNAMTRTFGTMQEVEGTIATTAMLLDNIVLNSNKHTVIMGISMGGISGLWESVVGKSDPLSQTKIIVAAHTEIRRIFLNSDFKGLIDKPRERLIKEKWPEDFDVGIIPKIKRKNRNTTIFYGANDNIVDPYLVAKTNKELGIKIAYEFPSDHYFMGLAYPFIIEITREKLRELC